MNLLRNCHRFFDTRILLGIGTLLCVSSCLPENLPISVEPDESSIAVASLIGPQDLIFLSLSRSFSSLSATDIFEITEDFADRLLINNAFATISYQGVTDTLSTFAEIPGLYSVQLQNAEAYDLLELSVFDSTTSEIIQANSILQPAVEIDSAFTMEVREDVPQIIDLHLSFKDIPDEDNYFVLQVYELIPPDSARQDSSVQNGLFFDTDNVLIYERLFTDRSADEQGRIRRVDQFLRSVEANEALVVLTNVERGYYNFLEARGRSGNIISSIANEPVNHPTNIDNGVGYFSAHQPRAVLISMPENF